MNQLHIFKTNINSQEAYVRIKPILDQHSAIEAWSIDIDDVDGVLRVFSRTLSSADCIHLILQHGHSCEELF
jgi:hypothetical protein